MIDSETIDSIQPLLMRSKSLGSRGEPYEAVKDVEKALQRKQNLQVCTGRRLYSLSSSSMLTELVSQTIAPNHQTHLRAMYAYLGLTLHHLELVEQDYYDDVEGEEFPSLEVTFEELGEGIKSLKTRELKSRFERVSPDLFLNSSPLPTLLLSSDLRRSPRLGTRQSTHPRSSFVTLE